MTVAEPIISYLDRKLLRKIFDKIKVNPQSGCWEWTGAKQWGGYGIIVWEDRSRLAHRIIFQLLVSGIPSDLHCDHLCRVRHCVNPAHIEIVTNKVNVLRGKGAPAQNARKTHCSLGHPLSGENLYLDSKGGRECKTCRNARCRARYHTLAPDSPAKVRQRERNRIWMQKYWQEKKQGLR